MAGLNDDEFELYSSWMKHIETSSLYFSELMTPLKSTPGQSSQEQTHIVENLDYTSSIDSSGDISGLNCYLAKGFVRSRKNRIKQLDLFIFAKDSAQFFENYDRIDCVVKNKPLQMRILTEQEQRRVEERIKKDEGSSALTSAKKSGYYLPQDRQILESMLVGGFNAI